MLTKTVLLSMGYNMGHKIVALARYGAGCPRDRRASLRVATAMLVPCLIIGCVQTSQSARQDTGTAVGAITGAILGHQIDHDHGALFGAAIGAIAGSSIGRYQDEQQRALESALAHERRVREIDIQRLQDETLLVSLTSDACFDFDLAEIKPVFYRALDKLANEMNVYDKTILHIVGHTDSIGSDDYNYALSIRRAKAVAQYLSLKGISINRLRIRGLGETEPRVANDSTDNRRLNRRVEIYIKPIVVGREKEALITPYQG